MLIGIGKKLIAIIVLVLLSTIVYSAVVSVSFENIGEGAVKLDLDKFRVLSVPEGGAISYASLVQGSLDPNIPSKALYHEALGYKTLAWIRKDYDSLPKEDRTIQEEDGEETEGGSDAGRMRYELYVEKRERNIERETCIKIIDYKKEVLELNTCKNLAKVDYPNQGILIDFQLHQQEIELLVDTVTEEVSNGGGVISDSQVLRISKDQIYNMYVGEITIRDLDKKNNKWFIYIKVDSPYSDQMSLIFYVPGSGETYRDFFNTAIAKEEAAEKLTKKKAES